MMNEDFMEEDFYTIETPIQGVRIIHKALSIAIDKWLAEIQKNRKN